MTGVDLTATYSAVNQTNPATPEYPGLPFLPGTRVMTTDGGEWIFVTSAGSLTQYSVVMVDNTYAATVLIGGAGALTAVPEGLAGFPATVQTSNTFTSGYSGWVQISGTCTCLVASAGISVPLYSLDTAGALTGATNTVSHYQISGITCVVTASGATASATLTVWNAVSVRKPLAGA
jgi:hypothetical protein